MSVTVWKVKTLEMCYCLRTTASVERHAKNEHQEKDPKMRRQVTLCLMQYFAAFLFYVCICAYLCLSVHVLQTYE